ncbi:MAG: YbaK/EbsC family protein [Candidatus Aenigmatarchaeota archaeon]
MVELLDEKHLEEFLKKNNIKARILKFEESTMKSEEAIKLVGNNVVKSILLICDNKPIICILRGIDRIDFEKIKILGFKEVRLAKAKEVKEITGYDIGSLPPFTHKQKIDTIIDSKVLNLDKVYCGGGCHKCLLEIDVKELLKAIDEYKVLDITLT